MIGLSQQLSPLSAGYIGQLVSSLVAIVALIFAIGWILKRWRLTGPRRRGIISVVDAMTLGPKERIVLLRIGESQVLIGIGAGGVVGLTPLSAPIVFTHSASVPRAAQ